MWTLAASPDLMGAVNSDIASEAFGQGRLATCALVKSGHLAPGAAILPWLRAVRVAEIVVSPAGMKA
jgi:hypothetical protein